MRRMRNASTWRESIYSSISDNGSPTNASPRRQVSFATLPDKEKSGSSQPEDDANNGNPVEEEEMAELAPTDAETPRPARNFSASELRLEQALTEDVYSLMYTAPFSSTAFVFAYVAFFIQFSILLMILIDLVDTSDAPPTSCNGVVNRLSIPPDIDGNVRVAQFCGVVLVVNFTAANGDIFKGFQHLVNGFDDQLEKLHPGATRVKFVFAGVLQMTVGAFMIMDLFLLMMTSSNVLGMCLNFAALHFVQEIDDVCFVVASMGLLGETIQREVHCVGDIMMAAHVKRRTVWLRRMLYLVLVITLYSWYFVIASWQWNGKYMCHAILVQFGDAYDPELAYFSGPFLVDGQQYNRPKYVDRTKTLKLRYSGSQKAWVFEAIDASNKKNIMIKSSETNSFDVLSVAGLPWFQNTTDGFVVVDWLTLRNNECNEDRCPKDRGTCDDDQNCVCHKDFMGENCQFDAPKCLWYGLDLRTKSSLANIPGSAFFFENEFIGLNASRLYGRYIYAPYSDTDRTGTRVENFVVFNGRRWTVMSSLQENSTLTVQEFVRAFNRTDTSSLDINNLRLLRNYKNQSLYRPTYFSSPVDLGTPSWTLDISSVTWFYAVEDNNKPKDSTLTGFESYRPDEDSPLGAKFLCSDCSNKTEDGKGTCQNGGICGQKGYCSCLPFYAGYQCEYVYSCMALSCFNGGTCDPITGTCKHCVKGSQGNLCQFPLPPIVRDDPYFCGSTYPYFGTCRNGQKCNPFELKCECEPPFFGEFCQNSSQATCFPNKTVSARENINDPCLNGGYCDTSYFHHPICRCPEGHSGDFCASADEVLTVTGAAICSLCACLFPSSTK